MNNWKPNILIVGPGGPKGYYEIGIINYLWDKGLLTNVKHFVGVSVGSIICLLLAVGYLPDQIINKFVKIDILSSVGQPNMPRDIRQKLSLFSNRPVMNVVENLVRDKLGIIPTLKELSMVSNYMFTAVTLNLSEQSVEYINYNTEPSMLCTDAVALSINIPGIFDKIVYKSNVYVDGALGNPYPVDAFDSGDTAILGISILTKIDIDDPISYLSSNINCAFYHMHRIVREHSSNRVKHVYAERQIYGINPDIEQRIQMIQDGMGIGHEFYHREILDKPVDVEEHIVLKSTYACDITEEGSDVVPEPTFPDLNDVIAELITKGMDNSKLVRLLQILVDWVDSIDVKELMTNLKQ